MTGRIICLVAALALAISGVALTANDLSAETAEPKKQFFLAAFFAPKDGSVTSKQPAKAAAAARETVKDGVEYARANRPKGRFWCVPFARMVSGVQIKGNAKTWWSQAEGRYERGHKPQIGAVMAFASSRSMPKGHVAVVSQVISDREVLIDHANWERNRISTDVLTVDVSENGDWSVVRVANGAGTLGRKNPVQGFIYN
jgi:hypothetical protein